MDSCEMGLLCRCPASYAAFSPTVCYDKAYTTLGSLGQIIWDHQLPLDNTILAASYVCPDLIELIKCVYDVYINPVTPGH